MSFVIYLHRNRQSLKGYVGYTKTTMESRFGNHCAYARRGSPLLFHKAIRKYGEDCWDSIVLETVATVVEAREAEKKHITALKTSVRNLGYNMTEGGEGNATTGRKLSPEHRDKVVAVLRAHKPTPEQVRLRGDAQRGAKRSEGARKNISEGIKARNQRSGLTEAQVAQLKEVQDNNRGAKRSDETRKKISEALAGKKKSEEHKRSLRASKARHTQQRREAAQ